jgi:Cdc6-like AAA superfamily ATPase
MFSLGTNNQLRKRILSEMFVTRRPLIKRSSRLSNSIRNGQRKTSDKLYLSILAVGGMGLFMYEFNLFEKFFPTTTRLLRKSGTSILREFEKGSGLEDSFSLDANTCTRLKLENDLQLLLFGEDSEGRIKSKPFNIHLNKHYLILTGKEGVGKTTSIKKALVHNKDPYYGWKFIKLFGETEVPLGAIYLTCPDSFPAFVYQLQNQLNYYPTITTMMRKMINHSLPEERLEIVFNEISNQLIDAARTFHSKYKRPQILVLDDLDNLVESYPSVAPLLKTIAKKGAETGHLKVVFITAKSAIRSQLSSNNSIIYEVDELTPEEAETYMLSARLHSLKRDSPMTEEALSRERTVVKRVVHELAGGLLALIECYLVTLPIAEPSQSKALIDPIDNFKRCTDAEMKVAMDQLSLWGINREHIFFQQLVRSCSITEDEALHLGLSVE